MRSLVATVSAAMLAAGTIVSMQAPAAAAQRPHVQPGDCGALSAKLGRGKVWQAAIQAYFPGDNFDPPRSINTAPCFASYNDCFNWLYWAQTDWPSTTQNFVGFCKRGMPYS